MRKGGEVYLPLHHGMAPQWLVRRMKVLADEVARLVVQEEGSRGLLNRLADALWFQAFGCLLGFDWHSSGLTTVVTGVLKDVLSLERHGVWAAGGKGRASRKALEEITKKGEEGGLGDAKIRELVRASRLCAKVDNCAVQDGYQLYHHAFFADERGDWCVVQQGLNPLNKLARRYHWCSDGLESFVVEPHRGVMGHEGGCKVLNMVAREAEESRRACIDLLRESPSRLLSSLRKLDSLTLDLWSGTPSYYLPKELDWDHFRALYDKEPQGYEELLELRGVGPKVIRALALAAELVYGTPVCWRDPVKFSFAHGGKDGVPFPVDRRTMEQVIAYLREVLEGAELDRGQRMAALKRLARLASVWGL